VSERNAQFGLHASGPDTPHPEADRSTPSEIGLPLPVAVVLLFSIVLVRVPLLFSHSSDHVELGIAAVFIAASLTLPRNVRTTDRTVAALIAVYLCLLAIGMLRAVRHNLYATWREPAGSWLMVSALAYLAVRACAGARTPAARERCLALAVYAIGVYVGVNVLLRGLRNHLPFALPTSSSIAQGGSAEIARLFGIHASRVAFPLTLSVNGMGVIAASGFAAAIVYGLRVRKARLASALSGLVCLWGLLASDSRGPFLYAIAVILLFVLWRRVRTIGGISILIPLSPVLAVSILGFLAGSGFAGALSRGTSDLSTGNNRFTIWGAIFHLLEHPTIDQLYGFGAFGQLTSGVVYRYSYLFGNSVAPVFEHAHNLALQTVLDFGYIGLFVLVALVFTAIRALERLVRRTPASASSGVLALLMVLILSGTTEAYPSYFSLDTLAIFILALSVAAIRPWEGRYPVPNDDETSNPIREPVSTVT